MLFGASCYHEYQPYERLDEDVRMMREAGMSYMRIGDSIWARCEPDEGRFDLDWIEPVLDALHAAGIKIIFTTPTYAIPPWLHRRHPEVMAQGEDGQRARYGGRQNMDFTHPAYLYYAERIIRTLLERYASHPTALSVSRSTTRPAPGDCIAPTLWIGFLDTSRISSAPWSG